MPDAEFHPCPVHQRFHQWSGGRGSLTAHEDDVDIGGEHAVVLVEEQLDREHLGGGEP